MKGRVERFVDAEPNTPKEAKRIRRKGALQDPE